MKTHVGSKIINAKPMTRQEYNDFRGLQLRSDENGADEGFLVEYVDGAKANTSEYSGYVSWSPKDVFELAYRSVSDGMTFGDALFLLKQGKKVARKGWNGKGMWLVLVPGTIDINFGDGSAYFKAGLSQGTINPHIDMKTATGEMQPGWLASQADMLAVDWVIVE